MTRTYRALFWAKHIFRQRFRLYVLSLPDTPDIVLPQQNPGGHPNSPTCGHLKIPHL
jgi:hypothetical protein